MIESEMEDLLWEHPDRLLNEPLAQFRRQPSSPVGRADLVFVDRIGRLLVIEIKHGTLERGAITQLVDYYGMLKKLDTKRSIELAVVANRIPPERRLACELYDITVWEIPEKRFRDVAEQVGYSFRSETSSTAIAIPVNDRQDHAPAMPRPNVRMPAADLPSAPEPSPAKIEKGWCYRQERGGRGYILAFVNARGSCSMRTFDAGSGRFLRKEYKGGDYQDGFADFLKGTLHLDVSRQPNLDRDCKSELPRHILAELSQQIQKG